MQGGSFDPRRPIFLALRRPIRVDEQVARMKAEPEFGSFPVAGVPIPGFRYAASTRRSLNRVPRELVFKGGTQSGSVLEVTRGLRAQMNSVVAD